jgi:hypothetical protein
MNKERLNGVIVSNNPHKRHGVIKASDGAMYFYFESESNGFDFTLCDGKAVTFYVTQSKKRVGKMQLPLARGIKIDEFRARQRQERMIERSRGTSLKEEALRQRHGATYIPLGQRRDEYAMYHNDSTDVPVAAE